MRTTDERLGAAKRRAEEIRRAERRKKGRLAVCISAAACLVLIIGLALAMPGITGRFSGGDYGAGLTASIFGGGSLGYVVVGILAFVLGVCVTVLCMRLRDYERGDEEKRDD